MSAFTALNVEPDENPEDDFDHTREIQLEEALKLYQNALKLHAQGPTYYEQAAEAYDKLFKSDVFKYPESLLDFTQDIPSVNLEPEPEPESPLEVAFAPTYDDGPSTLPQILYLAYKNHGQFIMDCLKHQMKIAPAMPRSGLAPQAQHALEQFTQALARDESDTELWRRAARVGELLGSNTISRYCLEAAVEVDDDPTLGEVDPGNLEEGFAGIQLKELLVVLSDNMALSHPIMAPYEKKHMPVKLKKYLDPYPFLSKLQARDDDDAASAATLEGPGLGEVKTFTWNSVAEAIGRIFDAYNGETGSALKLTGGESITLQLPEGDIEMIDPEVETPQLPDIAVTSSEITPPAADAPPGGQEPQETTQDGNEVKAEEEESPPLTRKRSQSTAGLPETPEEEAGTQKRSKRIRNRDTLGGETALPADPNISHKFAYDAMCTGDQEMFSYIDGLLDKLNVKELGKASDIQALVDPDRPQVESSVQNIAMRDLRDLIHKWDSALAAKFQSGNGLDIMGTAAGLQKNGLTAFLEHSKTESLKSQTQAEPTSAAGISTFVKLVNGNSLTIQEVAYRYFKAICTSYRTTLWPSTLKDENIKLMDIMDSVLYSQLATEYQELQYSDAESGEWEQLKEFSQMMLELHLDHYISIGKPQKADDDNACLTAKGRLDKWAMLTSDIMQGQPNEPESEIVMRYLWASVLLANATEHVSREHMVLCWTDLQSLLQKSEIAKIELYNNVAMPEVSATAADREISRLTTMDFFLNLFKDNSDPTAIIETLEPVIDNPTKISEDEKGDAEREAAPEVVMSPATRDMRKFLENGTPSLRLYLWQRLREAYQEIEYPTRVFSCHLKCIEIIVEYLQSSTFSQIPQEARHAELLGYIKTIDELLVKALTLALNDQTAFEIVDESHLAASTTAIANLCRILHTGTLMEDQVSAGLVPDNTTVVSKEKGKPNQTLLKAFLLRLSEMAIRSWALLYTLVREGVSQNKDRFTAPDNDLSTYLASVHHTLGLRVRCERSNKIFLKMMKVELIRMKYVDKWEDYLGQVLWDLYGLRFGEKVGVFEIMDHGCDREKLDRRTAMSLVEHVVLLANRKSMKDLLRDELRSTIESMQQVLGAAKTNAQTSHNLRNITEYLKLSVSPLRLNKALKGMEYIDTLPVHTTESGLAEKGWFFLLGMISLSKFRAQKRTQAGATDDLRVAASFFRLQLQFTAEHWETWYRLAQCFDSELEEDVMWSADKLNSDQGPLISEQRSAIHCYTMAVSTAMRTANPSFETAEKMSAVFHDFGLRIYSSSRDPFHMEAFYMDDFERHMSGPAGMYKKNVHEELTRYKAWRFAAELFKRAIAEKPNNWM
jgi:tetratricopeptide (TPR) repeat protein